MHDGRVTKENSLSIILSLRLHCKVSSQQSARYSACVLLTVSMICQYLHMLLPFTALFILLHRFILTFLIYSITLLHRFSAALSTLSSTVNWNTWEIATKAVTCSARKKDKGSGCFLSRSFVMGMGKHSGPGVVACVRWQQWYLRQFLLPHTGQLCLWCFCQVDSVAIDAAWRAWNIRSQWSVSTLFTNDKYENSTNLQTSPCSSAIDPGPAAAAQSAGHCGSAIATAYILFSSRVAQLVSGLTRAVSQWSEGS